MLRTRLLSGTAVLFSLFSFQVRLLVLRLQPTLASLAVQTNLGAYVTEDHDPAGVYTFVYE